MEFQIFLSKLNQTNTTLQETHLARPLPGRGRYIPKPINPSLKPSSAITSPSPINLITTPPQGHSYSHILQPDGFIGNCLKHPSTNYFLNFLLYEQFTAVEKDEN